MILNFNGRVHLNSEKPILGPTFSCDSGALDGAHCYRAGAESNIYIYIYISAS